VLKFKVNHNLMAKFVSYYVEGRCIKMVLHTMVNSLKLLSLLMSSLLIYSKSNLNVISLGLL